MLRYFRRNVFAGGRARPVGILVLFMVVARSWSIPTIAQALSVPVLQPPSWDYPSAPDRQGRDLFGGDGGGHAADPTHRLHRRLHRRRRGGILAFHRRLLRGHRRSIIAVSPISASPFPIFWSLNPLLAVSLGSLKVNQMAIVVACSRGSTRPAPSASQVLTMP